MKVIYRTLGLLIFMFTSSAVADCVGGSCTNVKIKKMYVTANGGTVISTLGDEAKLTCNAGNSGYISLDQNASNYSSTYSLLLTAHTTEHPIWVRTTETGSCKVVYIVSDI